MLAALAIQESRWLETHIWRAVLVVRSDESPPDGTYPTVSRAIDASNFPNYDNPVLEELEKQLGGEWRARERLITVDLPDDVWRAILESGDVPKPDSSDVMAGALCRLESFTVGGQTFRVVGRLQSGTPGLSFSYLCRKSDAVEGVFAEESRRGWIDPKGLESEALERAVQDTTREIVMPLAPVQGATSWIALLAIALIVAGGAVLQVRVIKALLGTVPLFRNIVAPMTRHAFLFMACHAVCYTAYFSASVAAIRAPVQSLSALSYVTELFTQGDLAHIGRAYLSEDVIAAAVATYWNNYVYQTLALTIVPSLVIPFIGVLKTVVSLLLAGFVLSPIWVGYFGRMTYHTVTLSLECEAYIIAVFAICLYPIYVVRGFVLDPMWFMQAVRMVLAGAVLSGIILLIAAVYEALTLIALT